MDFYHLLKILIKIQVINTVKHFLVVLKNLQKDATGDFIGNKIADKIIKASSQNSENTELNKEIAKERFISPEIYIQKEDSKLLITKINIIIL